MTGVAVKFDDMASRKPAKPKSRTSSTRDKAPAAPRHNWFIRAIAWLYLAGAAIIGWVARSLASEKIAPEDRRDGPPFALFLLGVAGIVNSWFLADNTYAQILNNYTAGLLFGKLSLALPVVLIVFSMYLMRHPSHVKDNSRVGLGWLLLLMSISGWFHIFSEKAQPSAGVDALARAGGLFGWLISVLFINLITQWGALAVVTLIGFSAILIMTRTAPNKIIARLKEFYQKLFPGDSDKTEVIEEEIDDAFDGTKVPWWKRS